MPNRHENSAEYKYGFNGMEKDDETKGQGNSINYKYRMHDPRVGRFFSVDPLAADYPHNSPYAFSENRIIDGVELEGLEYTSAQKTEFGYTTARSTTSLTTDWDVANYVMWSDIRISPSFKEGTIGKYKENNVERIEGLLNKETDNYGVKLLQFSGNIIYGTLDESMVWMTSYSLTQDLFRLNGTIGLNGNLVPKNEIVDRGILGMGSFFGAVVDIENSLLVGITNYSKYAYKNNWTKTISVETKQIGMVSLNKAIIRNIESTGSFNYSQIIQDMILEVWNTDESNTNSEEESSDDSDIKMTNFKD
jgi:RHS repeat-associated protein